MWEGPLWIKFQVGKLFPVPTANEPLQLIMIQWSPSKTPETPEPSELLLPLLFQLQRNLPLPLNWRCLPSVLSWGREQGGCPAESRREHRVCFFFGSQGIDGVPCGPLLWVNPLFPILSFLRPGFSTMNYHSFTAAAAAAKSLQSRPTLCDPRDGSPPGSPVPGILQARTLEWVAISFSNAWK